jgi:hypothetical protein
LSQVGQGTNEVQSTHMTLETRDEGDVETCWWSKRQHGHDSDENIVCMVIFETNAKRANGTEVHWKANVKCRLNMDVWHISRVYPVFFAVIVW